ncbi:2-(R)-hydroxypropyl-CoM dehydrogenase [Poriferisphaera corsica]|uniref:2-(R)-hydroxypropyl-CoM dehydrogenase n=1 Tax=Poriferisphaera corsica TaxID=2528020 RepID=A0A517YUJ8_9BACT|nr:SDR family oxidoreductase [Poriferisphaera corsica]QDU33894.1 2-(R)-hydroxypropyl-CoM dehydrogenase [Poriferisphaera corsica]
MSNKRLEGKTIVIVGGTTGLGLSAAKAIICEGGRVVVVGRNKESAMQAEVDLLALSHEQGNDYDARTVHCISATAVVGDAMDVETTRRAIAEAVRIGGQLNGLYHVAGGSGRRYGDGALHEVTDDGIDFTLGLNLKSMIISNREAVIQFRKQGGCGAIVNMGSVLGYSPSAKYFATHVYAATKSAIIGFTKSIAAYYAGEDIRCNVIAPALVETPMAKRAAEDDVIIDFIKSKQPLDGGRIGLASDLDEAVVFMLSDGAKYMTGQVIAIDGGWSVSEGQIPQRVMAVDEKGVCCEK